MRIYRQQRLAVNIDAIDSVDSTLVIWVPSGKYTVATIYVKFIYI